MDQGDSLTSLSENRIQLWPRLAFTTTTTTTIITINIITITITITTFQNLSYYLTLLTHPHTHPRTHSPKHPHAHTYTLPQIV